MPIRQLAARRSRRWWIDFNFSRRGRGRLASKRVRAAVEVLHFLVAPNAKPTSRRVRAKSACCNLSARNQLSSSRLALRGGEWVAAHHFCKEFVAVERPQTKACHPRR